MKLPLGRIAELIRAEGEFDHAVHAEGYSIDSRTVRAGELFFAVKGERLDGHEYVDAALKAGAVAAVVRKDFDVAPGVLARRGDGQHRNLLRVDDTLVALQTLGTGVRRLWGKTVVAITGSTGKTTTKEAVAQVLSARFRTLKSEGNLNNHFGLPLQLLRLEPEHEIAVFELGMSHAGEITALAAMAQPQIGVVTNVAPVHLEFFESIAGIARAKYELVEGITPHGTAVLNCDDEYVSQFGRDFKGTVIGYGVHSCTCGVRGENIRPAEGGGTEFDLVAGGCSEHVRLGLLGEHNVYNALAAAAVGLARGMKPSEIAAALGKLAPAEKRGEVLKITGATVINDCYNSNPKALQAMVNALATMPASRRIVVAGEMLELGPAGTELHRRCGEFMADKKIDVVIGVRGLAREIVQAASKRGVTAQFVETPELAGEWLAKNAGEGDAVLLKASRGVRLERALEKWKTLAADERR
jgi:UDP-N-acetylmuramoyl-tripeptide--D-alanyl-D-alanine ligase